MSATFSPVLQLVGVVGTWCLVIFGWIVVSSQNDLREIAKNVYARIDRLRTALGNLEVLIVKHHISDFDSRVVKEILRSVSSISGEVSHLRKFGFADANCMSRMQNLRMAATLNNFDQSSYLTLQLDDPIILEFELRRDQLDRALMEIAHKVASDPKPLGTALKNAIRR